MKVSQDLYHQLEEYILNEQGFLSVGVAKAEFMDPEAKQLEDWLNKGYHGEMGYMAKHFDLRTDPTKLVPGAKSVISVLYNYYNPESQTDPKAPKISMYAYGKDYHKVIRKKLKSILRWINENIAVVEGRCFVDSAPVLERDWARRAGLGWIGKHTLLINPKVGSYFFLAELITDLEFEYPIGEMKDHCGTCTKCIDACPTDAIADQGYVLNANKCISYHTIELKEDIPIAYKENLEQYMFGCDICQMVCPWNRFSTTHMEDKFKPTSQLINSTKEEWLSLTQENFDEIFEGSAVKRAGFNKLKQNITAALHSAPNKA